MGVNTIVKNIKVPNFTHWFVIPFVLFTIIFGYVFYNALKKSYSDKGFSFYSEKCKVDARTQCVTIVNDNDRKKCENDYLSNNCQDKEVKGGVGSVVAANILGALFVAFMFALFVYKIVLYIRNPKVAFGVILLNSMFH